MSTGRVAIVCIYMNYDVFKSRLSQFPFTSITYKKAKGSALTLFSNTWCPNSALQAALTCLIMFSMLRHQTGLWLMDIMIWCIPSTPLLWDILMYLHYNLWLYDRPLFASSLLSIIHILLDQTQQDDMRIMGCQTLFDFVTNLVGTIEYLYFVLLFFILQLEKFSIILKCFVL